MTEEDNAHMGEQDLIEEEMEQALKKEEQAKKLKAILLVMIPMLVGFLIFTYYFLRMLEANKIGQLTNYDIETSDCYIKGSIVGPFVQTEN